MTAVPLFDALASATTAPLGDTARPRDLVAMGERLVSGALADVQRLFEYEADALAHDWSDKAVHDQLTNLVYDLFQQWAAETGPIFDRVRPLVVAGSAFGELAALEAAWWRVQARLKLTPEQIIRSTDQARRGETIPLEGLRDELRARHRA